MALSDIQVLIPGIVLPYMAKKKIKIKRKKRKSVCWGSFVDMIKDLEVGKVFWIIQVGPKCNHVYIHKRGSERDFTEEKA